MKSLVRQIEALPPEAQRLVGEFVKLLTKQYGVSKAIRRKPADLKKSEFFGMWKDRPEMADSVTYVRELRRREWSPDRHRK